jgi:gliding motility-associated-like protein
MHNTMKKKPQNRLYFFLIFFIALSNTANAQNLVRNGSFENYDIGLAYATFQFDTATFQPVRFGPHFWNAPTFSGSDFYKHSTNPSFNDLPITSHGDYQQPRTGLAFAGLYYYVSNISTANIDNEGSGYIQTRLTQPLQKGRQYCISFYENLARTTYSVWYIVASNDVDVALTKNRITDFRDGSGVYNGNFLLHPSKIIEMDGVICTDTMNWCKKTAIYTAEGGEEWLTIGNFKKRADCHPQIYYSACDGQAMPPCQQLSYFGYYHIDDVSVIELSSAISTHDTTTCFFPFTIKAASGFDTYLWSTGETTQSISITQPGRYIVSGTMQECGTISDTITVHQQDVQVISRRDTTGCLPMLLTAKSAVGGYLWNTNESTQNITAAQAGKYWVRRNVAACSTAIDTIQVHETQPPLPLHFPDTLLCTTDFPIRYAIPPVFTNIKWSDNTADNPKNIIKSGTYTVKADWECGTLRDTFVVQSENPLPPLQLLTQDTTSCTKGHFQAFRLRAPYGYPNYVWNTGAITRNISVLKPEIYEVVSSNICGSVSDKITVTGCPPNYYIPNTFTPNGDGHNDIFTVFATDAIVNIKSMAIFDRWGEQVAELQNIPPSSGGAGGGSVGWDGTFKNQPATSDVYVYIITIEFADGTTETVKGDVTLLR